MYENQMIATVEIIALPILVAGPFIRLYQFSPTYAVAVAAGLGLISALLISRIATSETQRKIWPVVFTLFTLWALVVLEILRVVPDQPRLSQFIWGAFFAGFPCLTALLMTLHLLIKRVLVSATTQSSGSPEHRPYPPHIQQAVLQGYRMIYFPSLFVILVFLVVYGSIGFVIPSIKFIYENANASLLSACVGLTCGGIAMEAGRRRWMNLCTSQNIPLEVLQDAIKITHSEW